VEHIHLRPLNQIHVFYQDSVKEDLIFHHQDSSEPYPILRPQLDRIHTGDKLLLAVGQGHLFSVDRLQINLNLYVLGDAKVLHTRLAKASNFTAPRSDLLKFFKSSLLLTRPI
jgi:hypothetical protein